MTIKEQFQSARELIQNQQFDDARQILQNIDHPSAQDWLARVDEMDPPTVQQHESQKGSGGLIRRILSFLGHLFVRDADSQPQEDDTEDVIEDREENNENDLRGADLTGAYLRYAQFEGSDLYGANLTGAYLFGANLTGANLIDATFMGANLIGANLAGANLTNAILAEADLIGANLKGAVLDGINLQGSKLPDKTKWMEDTDMTRFTNPHHPDFWKLSD